MTLSVKSSWSWTLKETSRIEVWGKERGRVREGERRETRALVDCSEVEKQEAAVAVDAGTRRMSLAENEQSLRISSLWAICMRHTADRRCGYI